MGPLARKDLFSLEGRVALVARRIPGRRICVDEGMAGVAIHLASRAGDYVFGETVAVDGGA